jgi:hypothetical protein
MVAPRNAALEISRRSTRLGLLRNAALEIKTSCLLEREENARIGRSCLMVNAN